MSAARPRLIVNPQSGGGKTGATFDAMRAPIEAALGDVDVVFTERSGHAIGLARDAAKDGAELVIALGGDGTLNEVANGLLAHEDASSRPHLGMIAQGTGGDFRKTIGLEHRLDRYLDALKRGATRAIDVGRIRYTAPDGSRQERHFVNILSAGMGGLVDRYVADAARTFGGKAAYFGASLKALAACREGRLACRVTAPDGTVEERKLRSYMIALCNGRYFGSGMDVAPMAKIDDGALEVVSIGGASKLAFAMVSRKIYDAGHLAHPATSHFRCTKIAIDLDNEDARSVFLLDCDGEPIGGLPIEVDVLPSALTIRA